VCLLVPVVLAETEVFKLQVLLVVEVSSETEMESQEGNRL
jgi:hypothetical protein